MRNLLILAAFLACLLSGCGGEDYTTSTVDGVAVKVRHPPKATVASHTEGGRYTHTSTDSAGAKKECAVEISGSKLTVNGKDYGAVAKGDSVVIDGDTVTVNGAAKTPK